MHRTQRNDAFQHRRLLKRPEHRSLLLARSFNIELKTNVLPGHRHLDILHHGVDAFQNAIDFSGDHIRAAAGYFISIHRQLQVESLFSIAKEEQAKQNESSGKNRCEIQIPRPLPCPPTQPQTK